VARHDDYLAGQPGGSGGPEEDRDFIGVPDGYTTPYRGTEIIPGTVQMRPDINPVIVGPSYEDGTEYAITRLSVEEIARLQGRLAQAGLIGPETRFRIGVADTTTIGAYKRALETANRYGMNVTEAIDMLATTPSAMGNQVGEDDTFSADGGPSRSRNVTIQDPTFTDPATAQATARSVFENELGRAPTDAEYARYQAKLRAAESGRDKTVTVTTADGQGNTRTRVRRSDNTTDPSADVVADEMVRSGRLGRERNVKMAAIDYYQAAMSILGAGGGNV